MSTVRDNETRPGTIHCVTKMEALASGKRHNARVRHIRQQLADGKYNVDKRLNGLLDKLLTVLIT